MCLIVIKLLLLLSQHLPQGTKKEHAAAAPLCPGKGAKAKAWPKGDAVAAAALELILGWMR